MDPSGIVLSRQYLFDDPTPEKATEWGEQLWKRLQVILVAPPPAALRDPNSYAFVNDRMVNFVLARLVVRGCQIDAATVGLPEDLRLEQWAEAVDDVLDVPDNTRGELAWLLSRICPRVRTKGAELTPAQHRRVATFAERKGHSCYICGRALIHDALPPAPGGKPDWRAFEVDHIFPQARGGGRSPDNLAACCQSCNKYKAVLLSYADLPIESAITPATSEVGVRSTFGGQMKFALVWKQRGACAVCETPFYEADDRRLYAYRGDANDAYHFLNVRVACGTCGDARAAQLRGVFLQ